MRNKFAVLAMVVLLLATVGGVAFATYDSHITASGWTEPVYSGIPWWRFELYPEYDTNPPDPPFDGSGFYITGNYGVMCGYIGTENQTCPTDTWDDMKEGPSDIWCSAANVDENGFPITVVCGVYYYGDRWDDIFYYGNTCHAQWAYQGPPPNYESDILYYRSGECVNWGW